MKKINILHKYVTHNNVFVSKYIKCIRTFFFGQFINIQLKLIFDYKEIIHI